jgi:hypothetical protein
MRIWRSRHLPGASPRWVADRVGKDAVHSQEQAGCLALVNRDGYAVGDEGRWEDWDAPTKPAETRH